MICWKIEGEKHREFPDAARKSNHSAEPSTESYRGEQISMQHERGEMERMWHPVNCRLSILGLAPPTPGRASRPDMEKVRL